jgi:hypothetical protein
LTAMEMEKIRFLQTLHHDKKGGQMIRLQRHGDQMVSFSTCDIDELAATGTDLDTYTSINTFRGYKRQSDKVFNFESIYIDIDCHTSDDSSVVEAAKARTMSILQEAYSAGTLAAPTMITDTGRGFGLQYCLNKSIANTWRAEKMISFFKKVRKAIFEKYKEVLAGEDMIEVDGAVLDDARVCRLPGTYNTKADKFCRLISVSEKYYELSELVQSCHLWDWKSDEEYQKEKTERENRKKGIASRSVVSFAEYRLPFLTARLEQLEKLQELRGENCEGYREQLLFITYSALKQLDPISAALRLQEMNERFSDPLPQVELDHIIQETDQSVGEDHRGYYKLSNAYVVDTLGLTDDEIKTLGIGQGLKRSVERQAARDKKIETRKKIIELLTQADLLTYDQIAEATGVSRRTICTVAKAEGLMRYAKDVNRQNSKEKEAEIIAINSVGEGTGHLVKSAKSATGSVCVSLPGPSELFLSTPVERGLGGEDSSWLDWLQSRASSDAVALELLHLVEWSPWDSYDFGVTMEEFLARKLTPIMFQPERLSFIRDTVAKKFFNFYRSECDYLFGTYDVERLLPTVWNLFISSWKRKTVKRRYPVVDVTTETPEQREARIERYLKNYTDERFDIIETSEEYQRRLDPDVLRMVKTVCMQVGRLQRDFFWVEKQKILTSDIKKCFDDLMYKDIVIICERMAHQGTIQGAETPFYYVLQTVWKYCHPDAAVAQAERLIPNVKTNTFFDFDTHQYGDMDALAMKKFARRLQENKHIGVSIGNE